MRARFFVVSKIQKVHSNLYILIIIHWQNIFYNTKAKINESLINILKLIKYLNIYVEYIKICGIIILIRIGYYVYFERNSGK